MMDATTLQREVLAHIAECGAPATPQDRAAVVTALAGRLGLRDPAEWQELREAVGLAALDYDLLQTKRRTP